MMDPELRFLEVRCQYALIYRNQIVVHKCCVSVYNIVIANICTLHSWIHILVTDSY